MIAIIDYGAGNLKSVKKAFDFLSVSSRVVSKPEDLHDVDKIVLPGVGAFGAAMEKLINHGFQETLIKWTDENKPFLGICLGMQLLFESSTESTGVPGLGILSGKNLQFQKGKVPQIGWNKVHARKHSKLLNGIDDGSFFYHLHGYYVAPENDNIIVAETEYGIKYPSVINSGNIYAVQFHPEKSGDIGLKLLKNWVELK